MPPPPQTDLPAAPGTGTRAGLAGEDAPIEALRAEIGALRAEVARLNGQRIVRMHNSPMIMIAANLARGLAFGLGSVLGASLLVSLLGWWLSQFEFIPVLGRWAAEVAQEIEQSR
jgi:hypothetical protein